MLLSQKQRLISPNMLFVPDQTDQIIYLQPGKSHQEFYEQLTTNNRISKRPCPCLKTKENNDIQ